MTHKQKTIRGIKWSVIDQVVRQFVVLIISAVLSRLLTPTDFGLLGMVTVAIGFLQIFKDFGLGASIIQQTNPSKIAIDSVFWINIGIGLVIGLLLLLTAPLISNFYHEPRLTSLTMSMAGIFFLSSFEIVPDTLIRKAMDFRSYFFRNLGSVLVSGLVGIVLAFAGWGVWALVGQTLFATITRVIVNFRLSKWRPSFQFSAKDLKSHLRFSLPLLGESSVNYWVRNIDNLLVGKLLGAVALGFYSKAYSLMLLPVRQISGTLSRVMFPSFSLIKDKVDKVWNQYKTIVSIIAAVSFPMMAGLALFAETAILIVYGKQWLPVVPVFRVLCFLGALQSVGTLTGSIFSSQGKTLLSFKVGMIVKPLLIAGIVVGLLWKDLMGMVWGYAITSTIAFFFEIYFVAKVLGKKVSDILLCFWKEALAVLLSIIAVVSIRSGLFITNEVKPVETAILVAVFALVYTGCCIYLKTYSVKFIKERINGRKEIPAHNAG